MSGPPDQRHPIDGEARVFCPIQREMVDIEGCLGCGRLVDYDLDTRPPYLVCCGPEEDRLDSAR